MCFVLLCLLSCIKDSVSSTEAGDTAACVPSVASAGAVAILPECQARSGPQGGVQAPFELALERSYSASGQGVIVMPAIGDLDGDGLPEIAFSTWKSDTLVVLNAQDEVLWSVPQIKGEGGVAMGDVNGDGLLDLVAFTTSDEVVAFSGAGVELWRSRSFALAWFPQATVADLDGDGQLEVIADQAVLNGADGATRATLDDHNTGYHSPVVADLDGDGVSEILLGDKVYDPEGQVLWTLRGSGTGSFAAWSDADGDGLAQVFVASKDRLYRHDHSGRQLGYTELDGSHPGPPCVADFDGDGTPEVVVPTDTALSAYTLDGDWIWSASSADLSGRAGCAAFDVDDDGAAEVLYADEHSFRILDGSSGQALYQDDSHNSGTLWEYPVVADIDADGAGEICLVSNVYDSSQQGLHQGLRCYGHAGAGWAPTQAQWTRHDLGGDGVHFRGRPYLSLPARPELSVGLIDACTSDCKTGTLQLSLQVHNAGGDLPEGVPYWVLDGDGAEIHRGTLPEIAGGQSSAGFVVEVPVQHALGPLQVGVGQSSWEEECDPANNSLQIADWGC